jgi:hypothetical protein
VRDKLWIWGHEAGSHTTGRALEQWGLAGPSRITPTEAAHYMGIPGCVMVVYDNRPEPPFEQYHLPMASLDRVVWSIVGDAGSTRNNDASDLEHVLAVKRRYGNVSGAIMDDLFHMGTARHTPEAVADFHSRLRAASLDLWVVLYHGELGLPVAEHLQHCDVVTLWTMKDDELAVLEESFHRCEALVPGKRIVMGCYMWNYSENRPMTMALMEKQCELSLGWIREGRLDGLIFLASCICDLGLEAVEWARQWIARVGDGPLPSPPVTPSPTAR